MSKFPMPKRKPSQGRRAVKKQLEALRKDVDMNAALANILKKNIAATEKAHNLYIEALSNFLGHDMKNTIQNMDAILNSYNAHEITEDHLNSLRVQLEMIREVMNNFSQLVPHGKHGQFKVNALIGATEALIRPTLIDSNVQFTKELLPDIDLRVQYPFHSFLQIFTNLIINACNHLQNYDSNHRAVLFKIDIDQQNNNLIFSVYDTGAQIDTIELDKIFEYGYSTTNGSGIGLYHARYICDLFQGTIECAESDRPEFSKRFIMTFPFKRLDNE